MCLDNSKYPLFIDVYSLLVDSHFGWLKLTKIARFVPTNYRSIDPSEPGKSIQIPGAALAPGLAELLQSAAARSPGQATAGIQQGCEGVVWCWRMPPFQPENRYIYIYILNYIYMYIYIYVYVYIYIYQSVNHIYR